MSRRIAVARMLPFIAFLVIYAAIVATFASLQPQFLTANNAQTILRQMSGNGLAALGLTFVVAVRQFDMSFPWVASFGAMTMGFLIAAGAPPILAICGGIVAAALIGLINGIASGILQLPDIIVTIATGSIAFGLAYFYSDGIPIHKNFLTSGIMQISNQRLAGVSMPTVIMLSLFAAAWVLLDATRFGRGFYATGEARQAAFLSGIPVRKYVVAAFCLCAALATMAAIIITSGGGKADLRVGVNFLMPAYAAVFLGAALFGRPSAQATLLGTLFMSTIVNGFTLLGVPFYYGDAVVSATLLIALAVASQQFQRAVSGIVSQLRLQGRRETSV